MYRRSDPWWALALRAICAIMFGIAALAWPLRLLSMLGLLFGAFVVLDGLLAVLYAARAAEHHRRHWPLLLLAGLGGLCVGFFVVLWPMTPAYALVYLIGLWAICTGALQLAARIELRQLVINNWLLAVCGSVSLVCGLLSILFPRAAAIVLIWIFGWYALYAGAILFSLVLCLRRWPARRLSPPDVPDKV